MKNETIIMIIQLISGLAAIVLIFAGLRTTIKKLDKDNRYVGVPKAVVLNSTKLIVFGLLALGVTKTCSNYEAMHADYSLLIIYLGSLIEMVKFFGFVALLPFLINYLRTPHVKKNNK